MVKNALPGQKIKAVIQKNRKGKAEGRLLSVEENSPLETSQILSLIHICAEARSLCSDHCTWCAHDPWKEERTVQGRTHKGQRTGCLLYTSRCV